MPYKIKVLRCAITSRVIIFCLQVFFNAVIEDHDAGVFIKPGASSSSSSSSSSAMSNDAERSIHFLLAGFERWDGQYFLHIAEHGYVYEKTLAFFPLFPMLTKLVASTLLLPLRFFVSEHLVLLASATLLNQACFCAAAVLIYVLAVELLLNSKRPSSITDLHALDVNRRAYKAALLFCYNPASIFFSSAYSESTYSMVTFAGMVFAERRCGFGATAAFALSALVRSNGIVNAGFLLYNGAAVKLIDRRGSIPSANPFIRMAIACLQFLVVVSSFALFQFYGYEAFCALPAASAAKWSSNNLSKDVLALHALNPDEYVLPGFGNQAWCNSLIPISYGYVQARYWNVGFFRYFDVRQIPNFLLALPAVVVCLHGIFCYAIRLLKAFVVQCPAPHDKQHLMRLLPHVLHSSFLLVFGVTSMHVQVITRLLASSAPVFYLFAGAMLPDLPKALAAIDNNCHRNGQKKSNKADDDGVFARVVANVPLLAYWPRRKHLKTKSKLLLAYFLLYYIIGTACFSNFLPWT